MKFLKLKKVLAGTLAFAMLAGCAFGASAATVSSSGSSSSTVEMPKLVYFINLVIFTPIMFRMESFNTIG